MKGVGRPGRRRRMEKVERRRGMCMNMYEYV